MTNSVVAYFYKDAVLPKKYTICGVELKPFSMGHLLLLEYTGNPLINVDIENINLLDGVYYFFHALLVCSLNYEDNLKVLNNETEHIKLAQKFTVNLLEQMKREPDWNIFNKIKLFKEYIKYFMEMPMFTEENKSGADIPSGVDWKQNLILVFKKLGYEEKDIMDMNFKKIFYVWTSYAESEGALKVMNRFDIESVKQIQKKKGKK